MVWTMSGNRQTLNLESEVEASHVLWGNNNGSFERQEICRLYTLWGRETDQPWDAPANYTAAREEAQDRGESIKLTDLMSCTHTISTHVCLKTLPQNIHMKIYTHTHLQIHSWSGRERAVIKAHWHITSRTHIKSLTISTQPNTKHTHTSGIDESKKSKFESRKRNLTFWSRISRVEREIWNSDLEFRE